MYREFTLIYNNIASGSIFKDELYRENVSCFPKTKHKISIFIPISSKIFPQHAHTHTQRLISVSASWYWCQLGVIWVKYLRSHVKVGCVFISCTKKRNYGEKPSRTNIKASISKGGILSDYGQVIMRSGISRVWNCIILIWLLLYTEYTTMSSSPGKSDAMWVLQSLFISSRMPQLLR